MLRMMKCSTHGPSTVVSVRRLQRGFTLAEMMVVLAVITLIVGVTIPNLRRSAVRAELLSEVKMIRQALAVARIHALKNTRRVGLQLLPDNAETSYPNVETFAWIDENVNDQFDGGEEVVGRWKVGVETYLGIDDSSKKALGTLHEFGATSPIPLGVVFLPNGTDQEIVDTYIAAFAKIRDRADFAEISEKRLGKYPMFVGEEAGAGAVAATSVPDAAKAFVVKGPPAASEGF